MAVDLQTIKDELSKQVVSIIGKYAKLTQHQNVTVTTSSTLNRDLEFPLLYVFGIGMDLETLLRKNTGKDIKIGVEEIEKWKSVGDIISYAQLYAEDYLCHTYYTNQNY